MRLPFRDEVIGKLRGELPGKNLYDLAQEFGVVIRANGKLNKGWVGQTIERAASLNISNAARPDGADFELKSTSLLNQDGRWVPKETIKITQVTPAKILAEDFETSLLWKKLSRWILVGCHHVSESHCVTVHLGTIDLTDPRVVEPIRAFWEDVRALIGAGEFADHNNLGSSLDLIQLRPLGRGTENSTCPITGRKFPARAFYATKRLLSHALVIEPVFRKQ